MYEARIARLESDVEYIKRDISDIKQDVREIGSRQWTHFIITWGGMIALGVGLAGIMAKGFGWI